MKSFTTLVVSIWFTLGAAAAVAQGPCRGDVDDSGMVAPNDLTAIVEVLFADELAIDIDTLMRADANDDGSVTAADVVAVVQLQGFMCPPGPSRTPTRSRTPTHTATRTGTPTPTRTPLPTFTPTQVCSVQQATVGVTNGALTPGDCRRFFRGSVRLTDEYALVATAGQAIRIEVIATAGAFPPAVQVIDSNGYFGSEFGDPPIEFTATTSLPYSIFVTSDPMQDQETGSYTMTISSRQCPVQTLRTLVGSLDGSECPDLGAPSVASRVELADLYTFNVTQALSRIEIIMIQSQEESLLDPILSVYGPDGYEVFPAFQGDDAAQGGFGFDAQARFVAVQTGTYTVVAAGGGCDPSDPEDNCGYRLIFRSQTPCSTTSLGTIPAATRKFVAGTLYGDTARTTCPAPVSIPGFNEIGEPEINSVSDAYTFTAQPGDVFSAQMESDGDSELVLFGPAQAGNPFVALSDDVDTAFVSELATTLPEAGTYTLFAANRFFVERPDPNDPQDIGDFVEYEAFVQQCPLSGGLVPSTGSQVNGNFRVIDCVGFGGYPFKSYAFDGVEGQVVSTRMSAASVDASLRVLGPGPTQGINDDDPFTNSTDARVIRTVPASGVYFAEMSTSLDDLDPDLESSPAFTAVARACAPKPAVIGTLSESFTENDCDLGDGRKYDAYTFDGVAGLPARPFVVSVLPPANTCVLGLLPEGGQLFREECSDGLLDIPMVSPGTAGFVIAGDDASVRGAYSATVRVCALPAIEFGGTRGASLASAGCSDAAGVRSDWVLFRDRAGLVRFNEGATVRLSAAFPTAATIVDAVSSSLLTTQRLLDSNELLGFTGDLGALIKVRGAAPADAGSYQLRIDTPFRRQ